MDLPGFHLTEDDVLDIVNAIEGLLEGTIKHVPKEHVDKAVAVGCLKRDITGDVYGCPVGYAMLAGYEAGRSLREGELDLLKAQWLREQKG
jgi:hypothetical protein